MGTTQLAQVLTEDSMANALTLEAPPAMFDELASILKAGDWTFTLVNANRKIRGVRQMDTVCYAVTDGEASVELWAERRLGNPSMYISLIPSQKSISKRDLSANRLAERIAEWLVERGAHAE